MSHGIPRTRLSAQALEERTARDKAKLEKYLALVDDVFGRKRNKEWTQEAFDVTTRLLQINPELYTVWNYRRDITTNGLFLDISPEQINDILSNELDMTFAALRERPKVYSIWNHRRWCLQQVPEGPYSNSTNSLSWRQDKWSRELFVVEKMLDADARNFHAWNYRRYVLENVPVKRTNKSEIAYTTRKIEANFSNFSAWHHRTKILSAMWASGEADPITTKENEFELVKNALYTEPADQSAWLYHRWLIGANPDVDILRREIDAIQELLDIEPNSKWCMESLVHYKRILLASHARGDERDQLAGQCLRLLHTLNEIDPMRRRRYEEIEQSVRVGP